MIDIGSYWHNTGRNVVYSVLRETPNANNRWNKGEVTVKNILTGEEKNIYSGALEQSFFVEMSKSDVIKWSLKNG